MTYRYQVHSCRRHSVSLYCSLRVRTIFHGFELYVYVILHILSIDTLYLYVYCMQLCSSIFYFYVCVRAQTKVTLLAVLFIQKLRQGTRSAYDTSPSPACVRLPDPYQCDDSDRHCMAYGYGIPVRFRNLEV